MKQKMGFTNLLVIDDQQQLNELDKVAVGTPLNPVITPSIETAVQQLTDQTFAVILVNVTAAPETAPATVRRLRNVAPETPIILMLPAGTNWQALSEGQSAPLLDYVIWPVDRHILQTRIAAMAALYHQTQHPLAIESQLRESDKKFRTLAETTTATIFVFQGAAIKYVNQAAVTLTGYSERELLSMNFWEVLHPEVRDVLREKGLSRQQNLDDYADRIETRLLTKTGETRWIDVTLAGLEYEGQSAILGTALEITGRKFAEKVQLFEKNVALYFKNAYKPSDGLEHILSALLDTTTFDSGGIYLVDDESCALKLITHQGLSEKYIDSVRTVKIGPDDPQTQILKQGIPVYQPTADLLRNRPDLAEEGLQFLAIIPILSEDEPIGTLNLATHTSNTIDPTDQAFLESISVTTLGALILHIKSQEALRVSEARYQTVLNDSTAVITRFLPGGILIYVNRACCELYGKSEEDLIGTSFLNSIPENERDYVQQMISSLTPDNPSATYEHSVIGQNGQKHWHQWTDHAVFDDHGQLIAYQSVGDDITDRKRAEAALQESEQKYRNIFQNSPLGIMHFDASSTITDCNQQFADIIGSSRQVLVGLNMFRQLRDKRLVEQVEAALRTGEGFFEGDYRSVTARKVTPVRVYLKAIHNDAGEIVSGVGLVEDITESRRAEEARMAEAARFKVLFAHAPLGIGLMDKKGRLLDVNLANEQIHGYTPEELLNDFGSPFSEYSHPEDIKTDRKLYEEMLAGKRDGYSMEKRYYHKDGHIVWGQLSVAAIRDEQGEIAYTLGFVKNITEQKLAEQALKESEAKYRQLAETATDMIFTHDLDGIIRYINQTGAKSLGYSVEELLDTRVTDLVHPDWIGEAYGRRQKRQQAVEDNFRYETVLLTKTGAACPVEVSSSMITADDGTISILIIARDITHRKQVETGLRQSEARFARFMDHLPAAAYIRHPDGSLIYCNPYFASNFKQTPAEMVGKMLADMFPPDVAAQFADEDRMVIAENRAFKERQRLYIEEGYSYWLSIKFPIELGSGRLVGGISLNITEQVQLEQETEQLYYISRGINEATTNEELLEVLAKPAFAHGADSANLLHFHVKEDDKPHMAQMAALLKKSDRPFPPVGTRFNLQELPFARFVIEHQAKEALIISDVTTDNRLDSATRAAISQPGNGAFVLLPLFHQNHWVGLIAFTWPKPHRFSATEKRLYQALVDLVVSAVESRQLVKTLQQEQTMLARRVAERTADLSQANAELARAARLKDEFLANMSHELRTPLHAILGKTEILQDEVYGPLTDNQRGSLHILEESARHLLDLINDILDLSKIEAGKLVIYVDSVSVQEICEASLRMIKQAAQNKRLQVSFNVDEKITDIKTDMRRLKQMLVNLLSNATKFTPEGGAVGLDVVGDRTQQLVHFTVWDTGIGIPTEEVERLFQPFTQLDSGLDRSYGGTGLGLSLVARLAEMQGGAVFVESAPQQGSRFTISLPWLPVMITEQSQPDLGVTPANGADPENVKATILLVEDNEANILATSEYLGTSGYSVTIARNGLDALTAVDNLHPDLILMDIQMPEMDGLEAIRRIRSSGKLKQPAIIALTALAMPGDQERCLEAGADAYVSKPVSLRKLAQTIDTILRDRVN